MPKKRKMGALLPLTGTRFHSVERREVHDTLGKGILEICRCEFRRKGPSRCRLSGGPHVASSSASTRDSRRVVWAEWVYGRYMNMYERPMMSPP